MNEQQTHWNHIYANKQPHEVSWTQDIPTISLDEIRAAQLDKSARIIDIGGGDSRLVDFLLQEGYEHITVLDISEQALTRAKQRLGDNASKITWIVANITEFEPDMTYDFWHDRAAFHFLTEAAQVEQYMTIARKAIKENGTLFIGTFSTEGPKKCSGLHIKQYNEQSLTETVMNGFTKMKCQLVDHVTPFNTTQNFLFCSFKRQYL